MYIYLFILFGAFDGILFSFYFIFPEFGILHQDVLRGKSKRKDFLLRVKRFLSLMLLHSMRKRHICLFRCEEECVWAYPTFLLLDLDLSTFSPYLQLLLHFFATLINTCKMLSTSRTTKKKISLIPQLL